MENSFLGAFKKKVKKVKNTILYKKYSRTPGSDAPAESQFIALSDCSISL